MEFDQKQLPPELLYKLEEAKRDEARQLEPTDATNPFPSPPEPEYSPVKEVVEQMMAHWAVDADEVEIADLTAEAKGTAKGKPNKDLEDKITSQSGVAGEFVPDSAGPTTEVGEPETKPIGGTDLGGGGGGGGGDVGDDFIEVDLWRRKRRLDQAADEVAVEEEVVEDETSESETETSKQ